MSSGTLKLAKRLMTHVHQLTYQGIELFNCFCVKNIFFAVTAEEINEWFSFLIKEGNVMALNYKY